MQIGSYETGRVYQGDCLELIKALPENSIDTACTDPPYGIRFMGKAWDGEDIQRQVETQTGGEKPASPALAAGKYDRSCSAHVAFQKWSEEWAREALRVAKPGAILLAFGGTRTFHRLACAVEDAGWEIRDTVMWVYGSGFPKSLDISKAIDKAAGAEREEVGTYIVPADSDAGNAGMVIRSEEAGLFPHDPNPEGRKITAPATEAAKIWDGWGTALKPAWEPILVAMKPLDGTFAENAEKWGVAGLWIDGGRVGTEPRSTGTRNPHAESGVHGTYGRDKRTDRQQRYDENKPSARFPSNLIHDGSPEVTDLFPDQSSGGTPPSRTRDKTRSSYGRFDGQENPNGIGGSSGSAARFFYSAKASRREREVGLIGHVPCVKCGELNSEFHLDENGDPVPCVRNSHPTVKPFELTRYLARLTKTPTGGVVLDPFAGSGTTGMACKIEGREFIGFEKEAEYVEIANRRIPAAFDALEPDPGPRVKDLPGQKMLFEEP